ncbi:MAG: isoprenylcysteine carboxylmethyltransferase family protein [Candidatus Diapherotrites archaeon]
MPQKIPLASIIVKVLLFVVSVIAFLFVPAGTVYWPEAWLYIAITFAYFIPMVFYLKKHSPELLERRSKMMPEKGWDAVFTIGSGIIFVVMFALLGLDAVRFQWSSVPLSIKAIGFIGTALSYVAVFFVMKENSYLFRIVKIEQGQKLATKGPYAIVRHPMYISVIVMVFSLPLALGSYYGLIPAALINLCIVARTVMEDSLLQKELPGYKAYAQKTRYRLLPGVW